MMIKSQLPALQPIMRQFSTQKVDLRKRSKSRSRSRSRDRDKNRKNSGSKEPMQWLCRKCSFSNFDWRDKCKKCGEIHNPKGFVPGPEDWRCTNCNNINYARRSECNRCKKPKWKWCSNSKSVFQFKKITFPPKLRLFSFNLKYKIRINFKEFQSDIF